MRLPLHYISFWGVWDNFAQHARATRPPAVNCWGEGILPVANTEQEFTSFYAIDYLQLPLGRNLDLLEGLALSGRGTIPLSDRVDSDATTGQKSNRTDGVAQDAP